MQPGTRHAQRGLDVSIRARHCWRAMHQRSAGHNTMIVVSIRARHCWRAMPPEMKLLETSIWVSIRARHCWRAMPTGHAARTAWT